MASTTLNHLVAQAAESIVLLQFGKAYGIGFVASDDGLVVTSLHVVMGEKKVTAHLADGRKVDVRQVGGLDTKRDLAVLKLEAGVLPPSLPRGPKRLVEEGTPVIIFGMVEDGQRTRWARAKVAAVQVLGGWLTIYRLEGELPPDASGGPLLSDAGEVLGVVTVAQTEEGTAVLGVPLKYVTPMLDEKAFRPLTALAPPRRPLPKREIPEHPITILEGSSASGLELMMEGIASAISVGAPAYNEGNIEACYRVYRETARRLVAEHENCPGPRKALEQGLRRAAALKDLDARAWAMRDAFDGLMAVMEKFFKAHAHALKKPKTKPRLLN